MENGTQYGTRTNHDRDPRVNGVNGGFVKSEPGLDKGHAVDDKGKGGNFSIMNGGHDNSYLNNNKLNAMNAGYAVQDGSTPTGAGAGANSMVESMRIEELPDEIQHITTGILPLGLLLSRLAQISHNHLGDLIDALAETPIPQHQPNGLPDFRNTVAEDTVPESLDKKKRILDFIQGLHTKWVKALVITEWSRKSDMVGKLIDIKGHLQQQLDLYPTLMWELAGVKRDLAYARLPQPDLKTALQVLSYGEIDWMPEFGYIEPPPLSAEEQLDWIENLNTLLEARLTLDEFDKIPHQFRKYTVDSGRVTFKVEGEYEVDLTIADEGFDKQFWFLDFRFAFTPAPEELTEATRNFLEIRVNDILATDGLAGCYTFLHEFTLTHKITEVVRQALELRRTRWIDSLRVERLNRSMSIQYWLARPQSAPHAGPQAGPPVNLKSWFLLGVHSGRTADGSQHDPAATSRLFLRWFRDGKEVKDVDFPLDSSDIAAESILKMITGHHIEYILSSMYNKLASFPRYKNREAPLRLTISKNEPTQSRLVMQLSHEDDLVVRIDPITGSFMLSPTTRTVSLCERALNTNGKNPADEGHMLLERARWHYGMDELMRCGKSMGWVAHQPGLKLEELKPLLNTRDLHQTLWLRHLGWRPDWTVLVTMSLAGDRWWLVQLSDAAPPDGKQASPSVKRIKSFTSVPMTGQPKLDDDFFHDLKIFTTGMISQLVDLHVLQERHIKHFELPQTNNALPPQVKLPAVFIRLSEIVPSLAPTSHPRKNWAYDYVQLTFKGVQQFVDGEKADQPMAGLGGLKAVQEATIKVADKEKFKGLKGYVDSDVTFNSRLGQFSLRLQQQVGLSLIDALTARLQAICRLVDFVDAMRKSGDGIVCESVTMREVVLSYGNELLGYDSEMLRHRPRWIARLDLSSGPHIKLSLDNGNPHLRILDSLEAMANSPLLGRLPATLKATFSLLQALEEIEQTWQSVAETGDGSIEISHWTALSASIRYMLPGGHPNHPRQAVLDIRQGEKTGHEWWILEFRGADDDAAIQKNNEFFQPLKYIFDGRGEQWKGLGTGAAAAPGKGTHSLLTAVNNAVLTLVGGPPPLPPAVGMGAQSSAAQQLATPQSIPMSQQTSQQQRLTQQPVAQMATPQSIPMSQQRSQQQRLTQQPAAQMSNPSQGRQQGNINQRGNQNHEIVIID